MSAKLSSVISSPLHSPENQSQKKFSLEQIRLPLLIQHFKFCSSGTLSSLRGRAERSQEKDFQVFPLHFPRKAATVYVKMVSDLCGMVNTVYGSRNVVSSSLTYPWNPIDFSQGAAFEAKGFLKSFNRHTAYVGIFAIPGGICSLFSVAAQHEICLPCTALQRCTTSSLHKPGLLVLSTVCALTAFHV